MRRAVRRARGTAVSVAAVAVLAVTAAAGAAGCSAAPAGRPATVSPSPADFLPSAASSRGTPPPSSAPDLAEVLLDHLRETADAPDAGGLTPVAPGEPTTRYLWLTQSRRMCLAAVYSATSIMTDCRGPGPAERGHAPVLAALFGPGADSHGWYLVFRAGHGAVTSAALEGTSLTARRIGPLTARYGGGVAYFVALGARDRGTLTVTLADGGRTTTRTLAFGR